MTFAWIKKNPIAAALIAIALAWIAVRYVQPAALIVVNDVERFSTCYQRKQIYLNSCDHDEPTGVGDVNLEQRWGKLYIKIMCNLPFAQGGVMHTLWGAYYAVLYDTKRKQSVNLGSLVRSGDRWYRLSTELLGDYCGYDEIQIWRQSEDYRPKMILKGSITAQSRSSL